MTELLPCPFCGGEAKMTKTNHATWVECSNYHYERHQVSVHAKTEAEAIAAWNTRAERTCEVESKIFIEGKYVSCPYYEYEMECGGQFRWDEPEPPSHCPCCGARVVSE